VITKNVPTRGHQFLYRQRSLGEKGFAVVQSQLPETTWIFRHGVAQTIVSRVDKQRVCPLGELADGISEGIVTGKNSVFLMPGK